MIVGEYQIIDTKSIYTTQKEILINFQQFEVLDDISDLYDVYIKISELKDGDVRGACTYSDDTYNKSLSVFYTAKFKPDTIESNITKEIYIKSYKYFSLYVQFNIVQQIVGYDVRCTLMMKYWGQPSQSGDLSVLSPNTIPRPTNSSYNEFFNMASAIYNGIIKAQSSKEIIVIGDELYTGDYVLTKSMDEYVKKARGTDYYYVSTVMEIQGKLKQIYDNRSYIKQMLIEHGIEDPKNELIGEYIYRLLNDDSMPKRLSQIDFDLSNYKDILKEIFEDTSLTNKREVEISFEVDSDLNVKNEKIIKINTIFI